MTHEFEPRRLRDALTRGDATPTVDDERIRRAVAGELSAEETRRLAVEVLDSPESIESWRLARELADAPPVRPSVSPMRWTLAAAAALVLAVIGVGTLREAPLPEDEPVFRAGSDSAIDSRIEAAAPLGRDAFELRWSGPAGARYDVTVTTEDLRVLHVSEDLAATSLLVPADALAAVESGETVVWRVAGRDADGESLAAGTFRQTLE